MHGAFLNFRNTFYKYMAFYGGMVGGDMTNVNFRSNFVTYFWLIANISYNASSIYTMIANRSSEMAWQSACIQGLCVEVEFFFKGKLFFYIELSLILGFCQIPYAYAIPKANQR